MSFEGEEKLEYQRQYMRRKRLLDPIVKSVRPDGKAGDLDRYGLWVAARKLYGKLTAENWPWIEEEHSDWDTDADGVYRVCEHGKRYCRVCGTVVEPEVFSPQVWSVVYQRIQQGRHREKQASGV